MNQRDYRAIGEEQLAILILNHVLSRLSTTPQYQPDVKTVIENGLRRRSSLGKFLSRADSVISERSAANENGYSRYIDLVYGELPPDHLELSNFRFAEAAMRTQTMLELRKEVGLKFTLGELFSVVSHLADRDCYTIAGSPWGAYRSVVNSGIEERKKYYWTDFWGDRFGTSRLFDISSSDFGYGGFRKDSWFVVSKPMLGTPNTIPVLVYNPEKGVVIDALNNIL